MKYKIIIRIVLISYLLYGAILACQYSRDFSIPNFIFDRIAVILALTVGMAFCGAVALVAVISVAFFLHWVFSPSEDNP